MIVALLALLAPASADVVAAEAAPRAVVVYADRARVTRRAVVELPAGRHEVVFTGLPAVTLGEGATAAADTPAVLRGVDLRRVPAREAADARVAAIDAELDTLRDRRQAAIDAGTAANARLTAVQQARQAGAAALSSQLLFGERAATQATSLRTTLSAEDAAARAQLRRAAADRRDLDDRIAARERERQGLGSSGADTWAATVHVEVARAGRVGVEVSYLVGGASWRPRYDLRGDPATGRVDVALSAMIRQVTGEDWSDVSLGVSTARPSAGTDVPALDPFWLQAVRPAYDLDDVAPAAAAAKVEKEADASAPAPAAPPMRVAEAEVRVELAATAFTVTRREDVPADGADHKVLLTTRTLDGAMRWVTAPRVDPRAWIVAEVKNTAPFPLLAGEAGVFVAGRYLGDTRLETVPVGETFEVAFGVDDRVVVERAPQQIETGGSGPVGKRQRARWDWDVRVRNLHDRAITVRVLEQVPVTSRADVEVAITAASPEPTRLDGGLLRFELDVGAREQASVRWGYAVEHPGDVALRWLE